MTLSSSTTSTAGSVRLEPTSPASLSTVKTSSTDAFSCLPPQRTIAYTENSLSLVRARREICGIVRHRCEPARLPYARPSPRHCCHRRLRRADHKEYQTCGPQPAGLSPPPPELPERRPVRDRPPDPDGGRREVRPPGPPGRRGHRHPRPGRPGRPGQRHP